MKYSVGRWQQAVAKKRKAESGKRKAEGGKHYVARLGDCTLLPAAHCPLPSALRLLPSAFCPLPSARRGISLIEVLISIGVLALGLLGVAALFPVGSYYMLQAEVKDRSAAVAQQAFADLVDKGMLNPGAWVVDENDMFSTSLTGRYKTLKAQNSFTSDSVGGRSQQINQFIGYSYVLDPLPIAHSIYAGDAPNRVALLSRFPIVVNAQRPGYNAMTPADASWQQFATGATSIHRLPMRRITARDPNTGRALGLRATELLFSSVDDTAVDLPDENNRPGQSLWETADLNGNNQQQALARQFHGDYSWLATISPTTVEARDAILESQSSYLYDVSVVVFFKRTLGTYEQMRASEGVLRGHVAVTGTGGGEMIFNVENSLSGLLDTASNLKVGQYVMVSGPHPESTVVNPRLFLQWYKVLSIEQVDGFDDADPVPEYRVALRGPDWPWQPAPGGPSDGDTTNIANDLRIGIFPGAVAVHTKTLRLGGGAGNGVGSGSPWDPPGGNPPGFPPPPYVLY